MQDVRPTPFREGLYLFLADGRTLEFSRERLRSEAERLERELAHHTDPKFVDIVYRRCDRCPRKDMRRLCVQPFLPLVAELGGLDSFAAVRAVYKPPDVGHIIVADTTLQESLKYVSILAFTDYCETGLYYRHLFRDINPLSSTTDIVRALHRELFWTVDGDRNAFRRHLAEIRLTLEGIVPNLMKKVRLLVTNDALVNAIHKMHILSDLLAAILEEDPPGSGLPTT